MKESKRTDYLPKRKGMEEVCHDRIRTISLQIETLYKEVSTLLNVPAYRLEALKDLLDAAENNVDGAERMISLIRKDADKKANDGMDKEAAAPVPS